MKSISVLLKQLTGGTCLKIILSKAATRVLDPFGIISYSQFGEDRVIESWFLGRTSGVYVDIGCNHPVKYSNTWKLYLRGWRGLAVDPNADLIRKYKKVRPRDQVRQQVVSDCQEPVDFYFSKTSDLISGVGQKEQGYWQRTHENSNVVLCHPIGLSRLLEESNIPSRFELLSIDVEGHELEVLNSLDFNRFDPEMIVIEMHEFSLAEAQKNEVYAKLISHGFSMLAYVGPSGFFVKEPADGQDICGM